MTTYDFVHLVLLASGGSVSGRTKLQKVVYFVSVLTGDTDRHGYRAHYYGPYSSEVAGAVGELRGLKFLDERTTTEGVWDDNGFEKTRYDYSLTKEGKEVAEEKATRWPEDWGRIRDAVAKINESNVQDYVRLAIAAKTHLLSSQSGQLLSSESLKVKAAEHGWKEFTEKQYTEAVQFLQTVVNAPPQPKPATA